MVIKQSWRHILSWEPEPEREKQTWMLPEVEVTPNAINRLILELSADGFKIGRDFSIDMEQHEFYLNSVVMWDNQRVERALRLAGATRI